MHGIIHSIESYERSLQFVVKLRERSIIHPKLHCCTLSVVGTVHLGAVCAAPDQKVVLEAPCWPPRCESFDFCCPFATLKFVRKKKTALINQLRSIKHSLSCIFVDIIDEFTIQIIFFLRFACHFCASKTMHLGRNFIIGSVCKVLALGVQEFHGVPPIPTDFPYENH